MQFTRKDRPNPSFRTRLYSALSRLATLCRERQSRPHKLEPDFGLAHQQGGRDTGPAHFTGQARGDQVTGISSSSKGTVASWHACVRGGAPAGPKNGTSLEAAWGRHSRGCRVQSDARLRPAGRTAPTDPGKALRRSWLNDDKGVFTSLPKGGVAILTLGLRAGSSARA